MTGKSSEFSWKAELGTERPIEFSWKHTGRMWMCKGLLEYEAAVDAQTEDGATALHRAVDRAGYAEVVATVLLLELGVDIEAQDTAGMTALHKAVGGGHMEIVATLLEYG